MSSDNEGSHESSCDTEPTSATPQLPESETHFAFGPDMWYWIRCGTQWRFVRPDNGDWAKFEIESPYWVAFKHDTGVLIGGVNADGKSQVTHTFIPGYLIQAKDVDSYIKSREAYRDLRWWLVDRVKSGPEKVKKVAISIGPKGSYFARVGSEYTAHALPKDLQSAIEGSKSSPRVVALGARGAWVVLWADGSRSWDLRDAYPGLAISGNLEDDRNRIVSVALDPYIEGNYFAALEDGSCCCNATMSNQAEPELLHKLVYSYMQERTKRNGSSFSQTVTLNDVRKNYQITPDSSYPKTRGEDLISILRERQKTIKHNDVAFLIAVGGSAGTLARVAGLPVLRAAGVAASTSIGAALSMWYRST